MIEMIDEWEETIKEDKMLFIKGTSQHCECGCNVFRELKHKAKHYKCNACDICYEGE